MKTTTDVTEHSAVAVCACGNRYLALTEERALERAVQHEVTSHPGDKHARNKLAHLRRKVSAATR